jgi:hypothetical protein
VLWSRTARRKSHPCGEPSPCAARQYASSKWPQAPCILTFWPQKLLQTGPTRVLLQTLRTIITIRTPFLYPAHAPLDLRVPTSSPARHLSIPSHPIPYTPPPISLHISTSTQLRACRLALPTVRANLPRGSAAEKFPYALSLPFPLLLRTSVASPILLRTSAIPLIYTTLTSHPRADDMLPWPLPPQE